jgi:hypothetical protein
LISLVLVEIEPEIDRPMPGERGRAVDRQMRIGMMT